LAEQDLAQTLHVLLEEVASALAEVDPEEVRRFEGAVLGAREVFVAGEGRSGLIARCLAMRLMHLGRRSHVAGETTTPAAKEGDLLVAISASGETRVTRARAEAAHAHGAKVTAVTASPTSSLAQMADLRLTIPAPAVEQYGGSRFEQAALLLLDAVIFRLQGRLRRTTTDMDARHATIE
jgi:6-phospho-3-hexuloisomerase